MPKTDWNSLDKQVQAALRKTMSASERRILIAYSQSMKDIRGHMGKLYEKLKDPDGKLTLAEMTKYNRYNSLDKEITLIMKKNYKIVAGELDRLPPEMYDASYFRYGWAFDQHTQVALSWGPVDEATMKAIAENPLDLISKNTLATTTRNRIRSSITSGLLQGKSYTRMMRDVRAAMGNNAYEAIRIARTEGQRAVTEGTMANYEQAEKNGVQGREIWDATLDGVTRPSHRTLDGKPRPPSGVWTVLFKDRLIDTAGPLLSGEPGFDIQCIPGDSFVTAPGIQKIYRREYSGPVVVVRTKAGNNLTITPNHPVLTDKGWIPANRLEVGSYVISAPFGEELGKGNVDINNRPPTIRKVYDFASVRRTAKRIFSSNEQFHGDGAAGDVDIISVRGKLQSAIHSALFQPPFKNFFSASELGKRFLSCYGQFDSMGIRHGHATNGIVCRLRKLLSFLWRSPAHSHIHGLAPIPRRDSVADELVPESASGNTKLGGQPFFGFSDNVSVDEVLEVRDDNFSGHVYNLQTIGNWYIVSDNTDNGNGIIVHNCRCHLRFEVEGYAPQLRRTRAEGIIPYTKYSDWRPELDKKGKFSV